MKVYSSANTSVNSDKLPSLFEKAYKQVHPKRVLDYGCGKFIEHCKEYWHSKKATYLPYDPFNQSPEINKATLSRIRQIKPDLILCSNVLNVVKGQENVEKIIKKMMQLKDRKGIIAISVYEGNHSGIGERTGNDSYQHNKPLAYYLKLIKRLTHLPVFIKSGVIFVYPMGSKTP